MAWLFLVAAGLVLLAVAMGAPLALAAWVGLVGTATAVVGVVFGRGEEA
jgi:hypothetical protein